MKFANHFCWVTALVGLPVWMLGLAACSPMTPGDGLPDGIGCRDCHGGLQNPAPPLGLEGQTETSDLAVGAHQAHLTDGAIRQAVGCASCHVVPTSVDQAGHVDPLPAELVFSDLARTARLEPRFDREAGTCSNTWCHGAGLSGGLQTAPVWTQVDGLQITCHSCHGFPPPAPHPASLDCKLCHPATVQADGSIDVAGGKHIDGQVERTGGHPAGYADPAQHGRDLKAGLVDCRSCHGQDLTGSGSAPSCDECHPAGWRVDCTFCHGGQDNQSGAPPVDLLGRSATAEPSVGAHSEHLARTIHPAYACTTCHQLVSDVLSPGHLFDATPGRAEVDLNAGFSPQGVYAAPGCSNLYCHGTGRANGQIANFSGTITGCDACHPSRSSGGDAWETMSGEHKTHLEEGFGCAVCHEATMGSGDQIDDPDRHVNGSVDVVLVHGTWNPAARSCASTGCHGTRTW